MQWHVCYLYELRKNTKTQKYDTNHVFKNNISIFNDGDKSIPNDIEKPFGYLVLKPSEHHQNCQAPMPYVCMGWQSFCFQWLLLKLQLILSMVVSHQNCHLGDLSKEIIII